MRQQSSELAIEVLDALTSHIAVLDLEGEIVAVNRAWREFAHGNGGESGACLVGSNYMAVCERAYRQAQDADARAVFEGLSALRDGARSSFTHEYPCDSPEQPRWFILRATRCERCGKAYVIVSHEDITARKLAEIGLRQAEENMRGVLEALPVGVWLMDRDGRIVLGNPAGRRIWAGARLVGPEQFGEYKGWWVSTGKPIAAEEWAAARAIRDGETSIDEEIRIQCFDGSYKTILNSAVPLRDERQRITGAIIVNQDISSRVRADEELRQAKAAAEAANVQLQETLSREQQAARTDVLTGAHNRRYFFDVAEQQFDVARRYGQPLSVILFDIDHFKSVNDRFGHASGDQALIDLVRVVAPFLRTADTFARYGGEEFIVLLPKSGLSQAQQVAERVRRAVAEHETVHGANRFTMTVSGGVVELHAADDSIGALVRRADKALYAAKAAGRNRICTVSP